jgi:hypothetical protein
MKKLIIFLMVLSSCVSVKPFPDLISGDFKISELNDRNLIKCSSTKAVINRIENRIGNKMYFKYQSSQLNIEMKEAKWVGGNAYEGVSTDGKKYVVTMANYKDPYVLSIETSPGNVLVVGFKCWGDDSFLW